MIHPSWRFIFLKKLFQLIIGITFLFLSATQTKAQVNSDSLKKQVIVSSDKTDTVKKEQAKFHSPKKAALLSTVLPGAGQVYNKKYWKAPVIYAGFAGLAYSFQFNQSRYVKYRDALKLRLDNDASTIDPYVDLYSDDQLSTLYQYYHRYRDLTVIGGALLYVLNIVDATVDAHLFTFNVSDDLSLNIHPALINTAGNHFNTGIGLHLSF
ncbi:MAG: hypothetical protein K0Q95_1073 [Bacteroidota bacterium]|jgi:hypothetical protein|nr:hypothetical protein [Bacteroidota bacterium]